MIKALLTIDDIASENTVAIIDYLKDKKIPVLMFAWGENVEHYHDEALYALKNGIIVGNHSYSHPHFSELSFEEGVKEIEKCEAVLDNLYKEAGVERRFRPFRFPYGDKGGVNKDRYQKYLSDNGFNKVDDTHIVYSGWKEEWLDKDIDTYWTFDFMEYNIRQGNNFSIDDVIKRTKDKNPETGAVLYEDGSYHILLLHAHDETEKMCTEYYKIILGELIDNGVSFVSPEFL
jgi:peptidoglycan/xylan/chitin deacetylase (PgdA/CDA1 family)